MSIKYPILVKFNKSTRQLIELKKELAQIRFIIKKNPALGYSRIVEIDTESSVTFLGLEEQKEERNRNRVNELLTKRKQQQQIN